MSSPAANTTAEQEPENAGRGFWSEAWLRFTRRPLAVAALAFIVVLALVAIFAPFIVGTRPIVCRYKGQTYFPFLYYYNETWEPVIFRQEPFRRVYARWFNNDLAPGEQPFPSAELDPRLDPNRWAIFPLVYQDPRDPVNEGDEYPGSPGNPSHSPPTWRNLCGTLNNRVDVFAQLIYGSRIALLAGFVATGISALIGIAIGAVAGYLAGTTTGSLPGLEWMEDIPVLRNVLHFLVYFRSWGDILISRMIEVVMCIPTLVLILALLAIVSQPSIWHAIVVIGLTGWTSIARLTRAEFLKLSTSDYVMSARSLGASDLRVIFVHILPNALAPVFVPIAFGIASAILIESGLSFLGFGAQPDEPSWGGLLRKGQENIREMWWLVFFPGMAIFLSVLSYNLVGEAIQEVTDPRLREAGK